MCSAESRDCWKRGRCDRTSPPCTRSRMRPRPGRTSPGTCQEFMGHPPVGRRRQVAGRTARSCFVWPRHLHGPEPAASQELNSVSEKLLESKTDLQHRHSKKRWLACRLSGLVTTSRFVGSHLCRGCAERVP